MDGATLLILVVVGALLVIGVALVVLRLDAGRLSQERQRQNAERARTLPDPPFRPSALSDNQQRIVIGNGTEAARPQEPAPHPPIATPDPRIRFRTWNGQTQPDLSLSTSGPGGILFGQVLAGQEDRTCPFCKQSIGRGTAAMECKGCHMRFHKSPCWEQHNEQGKRHCPSCQYETVSVVEL